MASSGQRFNLHEDFGHAVADILVIDKFRVTRRVRTRVSHLADELLARFVHACHGVI
jgi:hypothetical protein